jgi:SpoVK/Ycf46/Vps4 family AAA+-type ATPase
MNSTKHDLFKDFVQLARIALTGRLQDVQLLIHRAIKNHRTTYPEMANELITLLQESPTRASPLRKHAESPLPVDLDSRLQLLRVENSGVEIEPVLSKSIADHIQQILTERKNPHSLIQHGLHPTKSVLFTGPPGVGKTLAAKWIASKLNRPLLILDLAAVMSSFLGRTGNNIRFVLDYAKNTECVLLLDELDAIAKRRDDNSEIGELKRLVTVLLQEIDDWPSTGLLIAATNHPALLDPAVWRRFELVINFEYPTSAQIELLINRLLSPYVEDHRLWSKILSYAFKGKSFSEIERLINLLRKYTAISGKPIIENIETLINTNSGFTHEQKIELAATLTEQGIVSQRRAHEITGVARETIRSHVNEKTSKGGVKNAKKKLSSR